MIRVIAAASCSVLISAFAHAQTSANTAERQLFASVNRERRSQGLRELRWDEALAVAARHHAAWMARRGSVEHVFAGEPNLPARATQAGARFISLAENVAQGSRSDVIFAAFRKSPNHRANILDSDMNSIGVGVVQRGGELFVVEDFSKAK